MSEFIVRGIVRQAPTGARIRVFDRDLRSEQALGEQAIDARGAYEVRYSTEQFRNTEKQTADLIVRVLGPDGAVVAASPTRFNAGADERIDLLVGADRTPPNEYAALLADLRPLLDTVAIADLREDKDHQDITFLSGETERAPDQIEAAVVAHRIMGQTKLAAEGLYGLFRRGLPRDLPALVAAGTAAHRKALTEAIARSIISPLFRDQLEEFLRALAAQTAAQPTALLEPGTLYAPVSTLGTVVADRLNDRLRTEAVDAMGPTTAELGVAARATALRLDYRALDPAAQLAEVVLAQLVEPLAEQPRFAQELRTVRRRLVGQPSPTIADLLQLAVPLQRHGLFRDDVRRAKTSAYAQLAKVDDVHTRTLVERSDALADSPRPVFDAMVAEGVVTAAQAADLHLSFDLARLTGDNAPLVTALRARNLKTTAELASLSAADWGQLVTGAKAPLPPGETGDSYAAALAFNIEQTFPTAVFLARSVTADTAHGPHVAALLRDNPELDLGVVDFFHRDGDGIDWHGVPADTRPAVRKHLMSAQRVLALSDDVASAQTMMSKGFDSAWSISRATESQFIAASGLGPEQAKMVHAKAKDQAMKSAHAYAAIFDLVKGGLENTKVGNTTYPALVNDLLQIDGLADMFGSQDYCDCEHCRSLLSPAAYFVDLMLFIEQNISHPTFIATNLTDHPLYLKKRRADLWTLQLTCENTDTLVPYLTIVNEVLESHLDALVGGDIYTALDKPNDKRSTYLPFTLPFEQLRLYLSHFGLTLYDIYDLLDQPEAKVWRARLGLSAAETSVVTVPDPAGVSQRFGAPASLAGFPINDYKDRRGFINHAGLTRDQLDDLLALRSHPDLANLTIGHLEVPGELQNFPELLEQLTPDRLDFMHRFIRLWRKTGWTIADLDLVLLELEATGLIAGGLGPDAVTVLGKLVELQTTLKLKVEEACAVVARLPVSAAYPVPPAETEDERLFERIFDLEQFFGVADPATGAVNQSVAYHCYSLNTTDPNDHAIDANTPALLGALSISETDLTQLFGLLGSVVSFDATGNTTLDRDRISVLYRHARLARALKLTVDDFIQSLRFNLPAADQVVTSLDQMKTLIEFRDWLKSSPFTVSELRMILLGEESATIKYATTLEAAAAIVLDAQASSLTDKVAALRDSLARANGISSTQLADTIQWVGVDINGPAVAIALAATFTDGAPDDPAALAGVLDLARALERPLALFTNLKFDADTIAYVTANASALGIANLTALSLANLQALVAYRLFAVLQDESEPVVQALLSSYQTGHVFTADDRVQLADLWQVEKTLIDSLLDSAALPATPIDALVRLSELVEVTTTLGINGFSLITLADDASFTNLTAASEVARGAFSSKYADETERTEKLEPYEDQVNTLKRDALCDYMIARQAQLKFKDRSEIYSYFLLDVDMCGCFRTSRIVCAHGSLQLYVQRCLLNLEQSDPELNPNLPDAKVNPAINHAEEWDWRKNYRVWEANRKVFLYPENYMEPDLRDDKSPIFEELENELLAQKVTADTAEAAYRTYMKSFAELTRLKFAGAYRDAATSTYHLFARTQQDPPQYYYRTWDLVTWSPWQKVELAINAPYVSAAMHLGRLYVFWAEGRWKEKDSVQGGTSQLDWYEVFVNLGYSFLDEHGKWAPAQKLDWLYPSGDETVPATNRIFDEDDRIAMDFSKLYHKAYPHVAGDSIVLRYFNRELNQNSYFDRKLDLFNNRLRGTSGVIPDLGDKKVVVLHDEGKGKARLGFKSYDWKTEIYFDENVEAGFTPSTYLTEPFSWTRYEDKDPTRQDTVHMVHSGFPRIVFTFGNQQYLMREAPKRRQKSAGMFSLAAPEWDTIRLSTSLANDLGQILFEQGLEEFLTIETQKLTEKAFGITMTAPFSLAPPYANGEHLDFRGAYGDYYRELFFHVPFRIASHLNANQMFEDAKWWYERIFDPTAAEAPDDDKPSDRYWRYIEFRDVKLQKMKDILADDAAIAAYKSDPFNPFAIARLRMSAFQKTIVMKYIDNLLDWGDSLFAQDTMESITEATMLYVLASQILGKRPAKLGPCKTLSDGSLTYAKLGSAVGKGSEFLIALENWHQSLAVASTKAQAQMKSAKPSYMTIEHAQLHDFKAAKAKDNQLWMKAAPKGKVAPIGPGIAHAKSTLAFCIPPNDDLLAYWDRVEDRLFKIHNCMNISGVRRSLSLFAPVIDPMALVRAVAGGLSLDEALAALAAPIPPYRFTYLIDKAKQYVATVQSFGGALLTALEKKDGEELLQLRSVHERNILRMTKDIKTRNLQDAQYAYQALIAQQINVQNRIDHYDSLLETGLIGWEVMQESMRHTTTALKGAVAGMHLYAGIVYLIPQLGSPFAMKFGGKELGDSASSFTNMISAMADLTNALSESASIEATFQRRSEEWDHQLVLANQEYKQLEQLRLAADIKVQIAEQDLAIHDKNIEQADELDEFYRNKFTNLGLYEYMSSTLNRLYRQAYNTAYDVAKMAERAFQFERDSSDVLIASDNWQFDRAGLLAGERLILQLQGLEKAYLQQNTRDLEVTQSFSLAMIDPNAMLNLRELGTCSFSIPEVMFDLAYPGQYRRIVKSVRLTVPCVAGPYTNIGAKLTLQSSVLRRTASIDDDAVVDIPNQKLTSIATSHAQNDSGLFELTFRDERYLPFEGAGAISTWNIDLPSLTRTFDYDTISDVIVHINYTARDDGAFKQVVENQLVDALIEVAASTGLYRLFSLRHDFPNSYHRLLNPTGPAQTADFDVTQQSFPYFLRGQDLVTSAVTVFLKPQGEDPVETGGLTLGLNGTNVSGGWSTPTGMTLRAGSVPLSGSPVKTWTITAGGVGLDKATLDDILVLVKYGI